MEKWTKAGAMWAGADSAWTMVRCGRSATRRDSGCLYSPREGRAGGSGATEMQTFTQTQSAGIKGGEQLVNRPSRRKLRGNCRSVPAAEMALNDLEMGKIVFGNGTEASPRMARNEM